MVDFGHGVTKTGDDPCACSSLTIANASDRWSQFHATGIGCRLLGRIKLSRSCFSLPSIFWCATPFDTYGIKDIARLVSAINWQAVGTKLRMPYKVSGLVRVLSK